MQLNDVSSIRQIKQAKMVINAIASDYKHASSKAPVLALSLW